MLMDPPSSSQDNGDLHKQLFSLQNILAKTTENLANSPAALKELLSYIVRILKADAGILLDYHPDDNNWSSDINVFISELNETPAAFIEEAKKHASEVLQTGKSGIVQVECIPGYHKFLMAPITFKGEIKHYLCILTETFRTEEAINQLLMVQMATGFFLYGNLVKEQASEDWGLEQSAGLLEVIKKTCASKDYSHACQSLTNELQSYIDCNIVALAYTKQEKSHIESLSETAHFDNRGQQACTTQNALNEAISLKKITEYPQSAQSLQNTQALHEHQDLHLLLQAQKIISLPLENNKNEPIGAISFVWTTSTPKEDIINVIAAAKPYLESLFEILKTARPSALTQGIDFFQNNLKKHERWLLLGGLGAALIAMFMPFTYKINTSATLEPVLKRQIEAPFSSTLKHAFVEPGAIVRKGDSLAELEEKDLLSQLAELNASKEQALKQAATALAGKDPAEARISQLEAQKLDAKIAILNERKDKLIIKSPIDGMIIQGELKRLEGSPLQTGETLLEIAPLDEMFIEIALKEEDFRHVTVGMPVELKLEAFPNESWESSIQTIKPSTTIRNAENVFILEAKLASFNEELRPGMKGNAKIATTKHPLYWILLHKFWDFLKTYLFW